MPLIGQKPRTGAETGFFCRKENERWYCRHDDTVIVDGEDLHNVWRQRAELRGSYVVLFDTEKKEERTVEAISRQNTKLDDAVHYGMRLLAGGIFGVKPLVEEAPKSRIKKDPYVYPHSSGSLVIMFCPTCRTQVRADQQHCEECGAKLVVPIPRYAPRA